jgi:hypothetical protein
MVFVFARDVLRHLYDYIPFRGDETAQKTQGDLL